MKIRFWISVVLIFSGVSHAGELNFTKYHSQSDIHNYLVAAAKAHPGLVSFHNLGKSLQGRAIDYAIVTNGDPAGKRTLYFNGTHHGDEWSATEGILGLMDFLVSASGNAEVKAVLDEYAVYIQPLVNPDGHAAETRADSLGRDPNRDYATPGSSKSRAFQVPEIQLVKQLVDDIKPRAAAAYHSGIEEIVWPWCYQEEASPDGDKFAALAKLTARAMGIDRYLQSYEDYQTDGEFIDYVYMNSGTLALTFEVSDEKIPDEADLAGVVARSVKGAMAMIHGLTALDHRLILPTARGSYGHRGHSPWHGLRLE